MLRFARVGLFALIFLGGCASRARAQYGHLGATGGDHDHSATGKGGSTLRPVVLTVSGAANAVTTFEASDPQHPAVPRPRKGLLIPLYEYPSNIATNPDFIRLENVIRSHHDVTAYVVLNPNNGPGGAVDGNYTEAIRRLNGAGAVTLGYVDDAYRARPVADVEGDLHSWTTSYPDIGGIFLDESDTTDAAHYNTLATYAHSLNLYPFVTNQGTVVNLAFSTSAYSVDLMVTHENGSYRPLTDLVPPYDGELVDTDFSRFGNISYNVAKDTQAWEDYYRSGSFFYATDVNGWSALPSYLEDLFDWTASADRPVVNVSSAATFQAVTSAPSSAADQGVLYFDKATESFMAAGNGGAPRAFPDPPGAWTCTVRSATDTTANVTVSCSGTEKALSGGCECSSSTSNDHPTGQGWYCSCSTGGSNNTVYANCCQ